MRSTILVVDDSASERENSTAVLSPHYDVHTACTPEEAQARLRLGDIDLVLLDLYLHGSFNGRTGFDMLHWIRNELSLPVGVIIFTVEQELSTSVEAMQLGANYFLSKSCSDEELRVVIEKVLEHVRLQRAHLFSEHQCEEERDAIIGDSPKLREVLAQVDRLAERDSQVLVIGESGTGKELIARRLHEKSWRKQRRQPFVPINCATIPDDLAESVLFGHEKGSFTGAQGKMIGKFEYVEQGTLFLDEVDSMPLPLQAKLLRVLEERMFERLGGNDGIRMRGRVVAASKRDLKALAGEHKFREDLYYRLNGATLTLPPLRERRPDIPLLIDYFIHKMNKLHGQKITRIEKEAVEALSAYEWRGNVRQLRTELQRIFDLAGPETTAITLAMFSETIRSREAKNTVAPSPGTQPKLTLDEAVEKLKQEMVRSALADADGNVTEAAKALGITRRGLQKMMQRYGLGMNSQAES